MDSAAPIGGKRRGVRRWRRAAPILLVLPVAGLLLGNLLLSSPWSCRWIASKIQRHAGGLEARIGGASFTPWDGVSLRTLELLQPAPLRAAIKEPLLRIDSVRVAPVWKAWLRGRLEVRSITLDTPRIVLPLELVSHLAKPAPTAPPPPPPPVAPSPATVPPPVVTVPPATVPETVKPTPAPVMPSQPTGWIHLKNASFALVHAGSRQTLLEFSKTTGGIPVSGDPARSVVKIGSVSILGNQLASDVPAALDWTKPLLSLTPLKTEIGGYQFLLAGKIGTFSGLPLQLEVQLPSQPFQPIKTRFDGQATAESITASARFRGLLLAPASWQGDLVAQSAAPTLRAAGREARFDRGNLVAVLRGGILSCVDARLVGDELSVLGNATLLADGRVAGVVRLVAPPEAATAIISQAFPSIQGAPSLTPLSTPQRAAFDLEATGTIGQLFLRFGKDGPVVELNL